MTGAAARVVLIARADDAGSFVAGSRAIEQACRAGVVRNCSIMAPAAHFEEAARVLRGLPEVCVGLHVTLTSEWRSSRWRPVLSAASVPSLVADDGGLFPSPLELFDHGVDLDQAMAEVRAQLARARMAKLPVRYVDEHMGVGWVHAPGRQLPRLRHLLSDWARSEGLLWHDDVARELPGAVIGLRHDPPAFAAAVAGLPSGAYCWVTHPTSDDPAVRAACTASGEEAADRVRDLACVTAPALLPALIGAGVHVARYDEVSRYDDVAPRSGG